MVDREDQGASSGEDRATAAEPVVSALRVGIPSATFSLATIDPPFEVWAAAAHISTAPVARLCLGFGRSKAEAEGVALGAMSPGDVLLALITQGVEFVAQGIEAGTGETEGLDAQHESPVAKPCAQNTPGESHE